jgi:hypothetical protein
LLDTFDRALTPKEIVQSFYKNPSFPLVPSTDDIRRAIYDLLHDGWELVDSDGNRLAIASPGQISINSINQSLRRQVGTSSPTVTAGASSTTTPGAPSGPGTTGGELPFGADPSDDPYRADPATAPTTTPSPTPGAAPTYKRYVVEIANRSITSPEAREQAWQLLRELAKVLDNANSTADHQLLSLSVTLTTAEGHQGHMEDKARQAGAKVRVEDDEFLCVYRQRAREADRTWEHVNAALASRPGPYAAFSLGARCQCQPVTGVLHRVPAPSS